MNQKLLLKAILRYDFKSFIFKVFNTINPGIKFNNAWYIDLVADYLENLITNTSNNKPNKRLIINIPPRCLKSISISVAWPAWILGIAPDKRIMVVSYSEHLSTKHSLDCRAVMQSKWYQELFPGTIISNSCNKKNKYVTTKFGFRMSSSVGGSITGEGADILILDDPHNPVNIMSDKIRNKAINWFEQTFVSRLNDQQEGIIVVAMQRLHCLDLSGYLLQKMCWDLLKIPAICDSDQTFNSGRSIYHFKQGDSIDCRRLPIKTLDDICLQTGDTNFKAQYLQDPQDIHQGILKIKEIKFYDQLPPFEAIYQSWDTAIKISDSSDYSVCTTWGVYQSRYYMVDFLCQKLEYSYLKENVLRLATQWMPKIILIEDKASGQSLIQDLKVERLHNIIAQKPKAPKTTRFALVVPFFTLEQVFLPRQSSWTQEVIKQITTFPYAKNDDIVDSISQFLNYIRDVSNNCKNPRIRRF
jgi:predicted phage terminase large subunit-like protein